MFIFTRNTLEHLIVDIPHLSKAAQRVGHKWLALGR